MMKGISHIKKFQFFHSLRSQVHKLKMLAGIKVKLVAIARNESAYLAEWIYHHLYFGFDNIEVHVNQCTDNTVKLLHAINSPCLKIVNADDQFDKAVHSPQITIYKNAFYFARKEGYTHLMFLDIDEFWMPANLEDSISTWINRLKKPDVVCFNWLNKTNENTPFSKVLETPHLKFEAAEQVKSVFKTTILPSSMNPHNVIDTGLHYCRDDGSAFQPKNEHFSRVSSLTPPFKDNRAFIVHRKYRSEKEYISMLCRGRPIGMSNIKSLFKDNRQGYISRGATLSHDFEHEAFCRYENYIQSKLKERFVAEQTVKGREFVVQRYNDMLNLIESAPESERKTLKRLLKNVQDENVIAAWRKFENKNIISGC